MAVAQAQAESPGLSRFVLPILGLIGLGLCGAGILVLYDPQGGPNLLASIYDAIGNTSGATDLRNGQGDQVIAKLLLAVIALLVGVGGIWLLFLGVGGAGRPAPGKVARPDPAVGLRRPRPGAVVDLPGLPRGGDDPAQLPGRQGPAHARQLRGDGRARIHPDPAQQRHLADRRHRRAAWSSDSSSPGSSIASGASRWPRRSSSCRWRSRSSARRSSGASSTRGSPPASRRSDS